MDRREHTGNRWGHALTEAALSISNLTLKAGTQTLLENACLEAHPGELTLIVGLSGSGKSLTLRLAMGLIDPDDEAIEADGDVRVLGEPPANSARRRWGCVFQEFGLLDEWSVEENIAFGVDHRTGGPKLSPADRQQIISDLLDEFDLVGNTSVFTLSRGMKQRCAIARSLAFDPEVIFYDEPTSGLDPARSSQVAERIQSTNRNHGKTSVVVTHDLNSFAGVADRIILLDTLNRTFREISQENAQEALEDQARGESDRTTVGPVRRQRFAGLLNSVVSVGKGVECAIEGVISLAIPWRRKRWGAAYLGWYLRLVAFGSALPYLALAGFILGLVTTWFTFSFFPYKSYTEPILIDRVVGATGFALYRVLVPGLVAVLVAARSGAAISADVGNRVWSGQFDALRSFGATPRSYLLKNIVLAQLVGMPLLIGVCFLSARIAGLLVFAAIRPEHSTWFWADEFNRLLLGEGALYIGSGPLLWKSLASAFGVAVIAWFQGSRPKRSGRDIAAGVTRTIILATILVLIIQMVSAFLEFEPI